MTAPSQPTPNDVTIQGQADVTRCAVVADDATLATAGKPEPQPPAGPSITQPARRYELGSEVARGGMGAILRAQDLNIKRTVAMKVVLEQAVRHGEMLQRFTQEAELTGQLEHPNIVPVHDLAFDEHGRPFYTMKFVKGVTLQKILTGLKEGEAATVAQYSLVQLLTIFQKVGDAIAFAHSKNVIHRDLKPANIMVGEYGEVLVMDWGLAKRIEDRGPTAADRSLETENQTAPTEDRSVRSSVPGLRARFSPTRFPSSPALTMAGQIMGSPQYMAPEQAAGEVDKLDARTDIFALGGILYNILTLHPPVSGESIPEMLDKILTGEILPPTSFNPKTGNRTAGTITVGSKTFPQPPLISLKHCPGGRIPASLGAVAMKALALRREDRYQSVPELQTDIAAYQGGFATAAENAGAWRQLGLLVKRHKKECALIAAGVVIISAVSAGFMVKVLASEHKAVRALAAFSTEQLLRLQQQQEAAPSVLDTARRSIEAREWAGALEKLKIATSFDATLAPAWLLQGELLLVRHEYAAAEAALSAFLKLQPDDSAASQLRAICRRGVAGAGDQDAAIVEVLMRGKEYVLAEYLIHGSDKTLALYNERLKQADWPVAITRTAGGKLSLNVTTTKGIAKGMITDLSPLKGIPLNILNLTCQHMVNLGPLEGMPLEELNLNTTPVTDLTPLRGMPLKSLNLCSTRVEDLTPLQGAPLTNLLLDACEVSDVSPLRGMPLTRLLLRRTKVADLAPLKGMPLTCLELSGTQVTDLTPLAGMPLSYLSIDSTRVQDLSPLRGAPLTCLMASAVLVSDLAPLTGMPLTKLFLGHSFVRDLSPLKGMPLQYLTLGGLRAHLPDLAVLHGMPLKGLSIRGTDFSDLNQLTGLSIEVLDIAFCAQITDFTRLGTLPIQVLDVSETKLSDLSTLRGLPLRELYITGSRVTNLTPLAGIKLEALSLSRSNMVTGVEVIRTMKSIRKFNPIGINFFGGMMGGTPPDEFWQKYDAGEFK